MFRKIMNAIREVFGTANKEVGKPSQFLPPAMKRRVVYQVYDGDNYGLVLTRGQIYSVYSEKIYLVNMFSGRFKEVYENKFSVDESIMTRIETVDLISTDSQNLILVYKTYENKETGLVSSFKVTQNISKEDF